MMAGCWIFFLGGGGKGRVYRPSRSQGVNKNKTKENPDKASVSRSNDTENYLPCWEGWFVEAGKAVETAFDITAGSEDDASVKVHDKNTLTQYRFQLFKYYISFFFIVLIFLCSICRWLCQNCYRWLGGDYALMVKCEVIGHDGGILEKLFFLRVYKQRRSPGEKKKQTNKNKNKQTNKKNKKKKRGTFQPPSWPHAWSIEDLLYMAQTMKTCACWTNAGNSEGQFLARSGSPSEHSICFILPAREFSRIRRKNKQNITALKLS